MKNNKTLLHLLIACGLFGALSIMLNQYAIQQESIIRNNQIETNKKQLIATSMKSFVSKIINIEMTSNNYYNSIQSRFFVIKTPKLN